MRLPVQLCKRKPETHKGDYGRLLVVGASRGLTGAVCLCAQAALRAGCGLVTVCVPSSLNPIFEIKLTEVMSFPLRESEKGVLSPAAFGQIRDLSRKADVLAVGCGASRENSAQILIRKVIRDIANPCIIDADGINALSGNLDLLQKRKENNLILTPHYGEFSRLINKSVDYIIKKRKALAKEFALRYNLILVLKGHRSIVTDGKRFFENKSGNPGMATAGSGDVLSGIISSLFAQGMELFDAAKFGVYLHGLAGDYAAREKTQNCLIASDIIEYLPRAIKAEIAKSE